MSRHRKCSTLAVMSALLASSLAVPLYASTPKNLDQIIPDDVLLFAWEQHNPQKEFVKDYWDDVFEALKETGIGDDLMDLLSSAVGQEGLEEIERLKERATRLLEGVDWAQLCGGEMVFAERHAPPQHSPGGVYMGPPDMVWLFRGSEEGVARNYHGLVEILKALAEEINRLADAEVLLLEHISKNDVKRATVNLLGAIPEAPSLPLGVTRRGDIVFIHLGEQLADDVLALLDGTSAKRPLAESRRFRTAFDPLPQPEDCKVFFDWQSFLKPMLKMSRMVMTFIKSPHDVYRNTGMKDEVRKLHMRSLAAYRKWDYAEALRLTREAYELDPDNSILLYNMACFSALTGKKAKALDWLIEAVEGGFWAPNKIASDPDLESLRSDPRYEAALEKASEAARESQVEDVVINSTKSGEAYKLSAQAWEAYERKDHEQGLTLVQQAYEIAPEDSRVLYYLACFHSLLGHEEKALHFLNKAVKGGFYCPKHISKDPDLEPIRSSQGYRQALDTAREQAAEMVEKKASHDLALADTIVDRATDAVGIFDYIAEVSTTEGYAVRTETIIAMVPDASQRSIYPVLGKPRPLKQFDRFLPKETRSFSVSSGIRVVTLYDYVEETLRAGGPTGEWLLEKWEDWQKKVGLDVRKDVIGWIEGQTIYVSLEDHLGGVFMLKVSDDRIAREKVNAALDLMTGKLNEFMTKVPMLAMVAPRRSAVTDEKLRGFENIHFGISPKPVVWGVSDGYLILSSSPRAVRLCLDTAHGEHPGIRENKRLMAEAMIPTGECTSVSLTDYRNLGEELAMFCGFVPLMTGPMAMQIKDPKGKMVIGKIARMIAKLPPVLRKINFYKSTSSYTTFDGQAWHVHQRTNYFSPQERAQRVIQAQTPEEATEGL